MDAVRYRQSRQQTRRHAFHVAFDAGELPGDEHIGSVVQAEIGLEKSRRVDVSIAVDLSVAQELGVFKAWNHAQNPLLLGKLQVVLKAYQVVAGKTQILRTQLHNGVRLLVGPGVYQTDGLHRTESQRLHAAPRQLLDGQAGLEVVQVFKLVGPHRLSLKQSLVESSVLLL